MYATILTIQSYDTIAADAITLKNLTTVDGNWSRLLCNGYLWEYAGIWHGGAVS